MVCATAGPTVTKLLYLLKICDWRDFGGKKENKKFHFGCKYNLKVNVKLKYIYFSMSFPGCPADPSRRKAADAMHSHIITPREVTVGFKGGSLSPRNILQLNGKASNPPLTKSRLAPDGLTARLTLLSFALPCAYLSLSRPCRRRTRRGAFHPATGRLAPFLFGWRLCLRRRQPDQIPFTFCLLAVPLNFRPN